jgi:hypothetical protein
MPIPFRYRGPFKDDCDAGRSLSNGKRRSRQVFCPRILIKLAGTSQIKGPEAVTLRFMIGTDNGAVFRDPP